MLMKMKLLSLLFFLFSLEVSYAQTKLKADPGQHSLINELLKKIEVDPDNPLSVDKKLLTEVANALPAGTLKDKLLTYSANFGRDQNLSMRQIYWDLNAAFSSNSSLSKIAPVAKTGKSLDVLLNQTDL